MNETEHGLSRYVGHLAEGAMRFRNEVSVGTEAPDFELPSLDGGFVRLSKFRGKSGVVLIFGSFTCGSTVTQLRAGKPPLGALYRRFRRKGFEFFLVYNVCIMRGGFSKRKRCRFRSSSMGLAMSCASCITL